MKNDDIKGITPQKSINFYEGKLKNFHWSNIIFFLTDHNEKSKPEGSYHKYAYQRFCKAIQPDHLDELIPEADSIPLPNQKPSSMKERVRQRN